jgi:hypothetical protein
MRASTTHLYLLRRTPFFTGLSTEQLRYVIGHSREWEAQAATVVAGSADEADDVWILLDGGWQVQYEGRSYPSGHASPGKWYSPRRLDGDCVLLTTEHSYVMKIARADFDAMIEEGFAFQKHLDAGIAYYRSIRAGTAAQ